MNFLSKIFPPRVRTAFKFVRGRFDAAQTNGDNAKHWQSAEFLSADAEASADVRKILRVRSRYEINNNSYARGVVLTLANDSVGTGPRLQMLTGDHTLNNTIEAAFLTWAKEINLAAKLRTVRMARCQDGEAFILMANNPNLKHENVKLDLQLIEADRVTEDNFNRDPACVDGVTFDRFGNPTHYRVLKYHPGGEWPTPEDAVINVPAEFMIHIFRQDRPGQHRGVPEITPALPLFAQLRRFTLAVLSAAEAAADFAGILYTDAPPDGEAERISPFDSFQLERNMLLTMPGGWKMGQLDPKQPATTYAEFKHEILNEIARCLNMPYNIAAGNSSGYNYASGRLDHQTYYKSIRVDQEFTANVVLDRILELWLREYTLARGIALESDEHTWFWDGMEHVDPAKEANAQATKLKSLTTTLANEYARQGKDWEAELRQIAAEKKLLQELGITTAEAEPKNQGEKINE
jgi:lambda family phage portal protein